jgi:hypothetical protein
VKEVLLRNISMELFTNKIVEVKRAVTERRAPWIVGWYCLKLIKVYVEESERSQQPLIISS